MRHCAVILISLVVACSNGGGDNGPPSSPTPLPMPTPMPTPDFCFEPDCQGDTRVFCPPGDPALSGETCPFGCEAGACLDAVCEAGDRRCESPEDALQRVVECAPDRRTFALAEQCEHGCEGGSCLACVPASTRCEGDDQIMRCRDDGLGFEPGDSCELGCIDGRCRACAADYAACEGDDRVRCADDASGLEVAETCENGCVDGACLGAACNPEERRCEDGVVWVCAADRTGFEASTRCEFACAEGACVAPSAQLCVLEPLLRCAPEVEIDLGLLPVGSDKPLVLELSNTGDANLDLTALRYDSGELLSEVSVPELPLSLAPDGFEELRYNLRPMAPGPVSVTVHLAVVDPELGELSATFGGTATLPPELLLGVDDGEDGFVALNDGDTLEYRRGFQGLGDVWVSFRARGVLPNGQLSLSMIRGTDAWIPSFRREATFILREEGPDAGEQTLIRRRFTVSGEADPEVLEGAQVDLSAAFTDNEGRVVSGSRSVVLDVVDFP